MQKITAISIALNVVIIAGIIAKKIYYSHKSSNKGEMSYADSWNRGRTLVFEDLPSDTADIVFVGDSQTEKFPLNEMIRNDHVKNRGIGFNTSAHILGRIDNILLGQPHKLFLQMGINDFENGISSDSLFKNYIAVIHRVRKLSPTTTLFIESIFPLSHYTEQGRKWEDTVERFNSRLKALCRQEQVQFIDIFTGLYKNNGIDTTLSWDGLHLNGDGYVIWAKKVEPYI